jgi:hypothetical protein
MQFRAALFATLVHLPGREKFFISIITISVIARLATKRMMRNLRHKLLLTLFAASNLSPFKRDCHDDVYVLLRSGRQARPRVHGRARCCRSHVQRPA